MILPYKALPHHGINPAGDCGPCCLAGITGIPVQEIYDKYLGRVDGTSYSDIYEACWKLKVDGKINHVHTELPIIKKRPDAEYQVFGNPSWENFREWSKHVHHLLQRGYVGMAQVHKDGDSMGDRKHQWYTNHWVLIKGIDYDENASAVDLAVHISCSSLGEYSKKPLEFLMNYGGYNPIWILPKK